MIWWPTIAFTGIRQVTEAQRLFIAESISDLQKPEHIVTGAALGVDSIACVSAYTLWPEIQHTLVVPAAPHDKALVQWAIANALEVVRLPEIPGGVSPNYMARNRYMVDLADFLVAFPKTPVEERRSGTWATIRRAREKGIPVEIHSLDQAKL